MSDAATIQNGRAAIAAGSKSFAGAAKLFDRNTRESAVMLYAWCRHCDDVVDGQVLGFRGADDREDAVEGLRVLEGETRKALSEGDHALPAFAGLARVVAKHDIPDTLPLAHLAGFRMDVQGRSYGTIEDTLDYCYHVAGVVGLMMAHIMGVRDDETLDRACDLGLAFQLTNIARDIVADAEVGRVYLPLAWLDEAGLATGDVADPGHRGTIAVLSRRLVDEAEFYYASADGGIGALPLRSAIAIATARNVYRAIGWKVVRAGRAAWDTRASTSREEKLLFALRGILTGVATRRRIRVGALVPSRPRHQWIRPA